MRKTTVLIITFIISAILALIQQETGTPRVLITQTLPVSSEYFNSFLSITDSEGKVLKGIGSSQVRVFQNGEEVDDFTLAAVSQYNQWVAVAMAVDISGSMKGAKLQGAKEAAVDFAGRVAERDRLALLAFDVEMEWVADFSADRGLFKAAVESLETRGDTSLYDAILFLIGKLEGMEAPRSAIVLLTDGMDTKSRAKQKECLEAVKESGIPIFTIGLGEDVDQTTLRKIAETSHGMHLYAHKPEDLRQVYAAIAEHIQSQYVLRHRFIGDPHRPVLEIRVEVTLEEGIFSDTRKFSSPMDVISEPAKADSKETGKESYERYWQVLFDPITVAMVGLGVLVGIAIGWILALVLRNRGYGMGTVVLIIVLCAIAFGLTGLLFSVVM